MKLINLFVTSFFFLLASFGFAQEKGFVRGNITDGEFGGPMIGAAIVLADNPTVGTTTDFDGNYSLPLDPGTYTLQVSFISYATMTYKEVVVKAGEVTVIDAEMKTSVEQLQAVEVVATASRNSEAGMLMEMKNASNVVDGLSAQSFRKVGDSDLSGAIKRVPGVTVQGGKYVYVRGLGDRYTKTTLNGMSIPGLDPDVNAVQIDIFPTAVLENVSVSKSFVPNQYGDYTGGLVNVVTKSFPEEKYTRVRVGLDYVQGQTFNDDYTTYDGGNLDFLGFDDGTRKLPFDNETVFLDPVFPNSNNEKTNDFQRNLAVQTSTALPGGTFSFAHGNQINKEEGPTLGYNVIFNYKNTTNFYDEYETNIYFKESPTDVDPFREESRLGVLGTNQAIWSGMLSGAVKYKKHQYSAMLLHTQSGESSASKRTVRNFGENPSTLVEDILTYTQRSLSTLFLSGKHNFDKFRMEWTNTFTYSRVYDPDFRTTSISVDPDTTLNSGNGAGLNRFWRNLYEINENIRVDFTIPVKKNFDIKAGANGLYKFRDFVTYQYDHSRRNTSDISIDPDWFLRDENIYDAVSNPNGTFTKGRPELPNSFQSRQVVLGAYAMAEHPVKGRLKLIYGLRVEQGLMYYTGWESNTIFPDNPDNPSTPIPDPEFDDTLTLDELNFLPSLNTVFALNENMNLRASVTQTIARPSFREKSLALIQDPISRRTFVGNIDLNQTEIWNFDLRYEWFITPREVVSVAAFYKMFDGHIEMTPNLREPDEFKPRNSGDAFVLGTEIELRKSMQGITNNKHIDRIFIGGNVTFVQSGVNMTQIQVENDTDDGAATTELELREQWLAPGQSIDNYDDNWFNNNVLEAFFGGEDLGSFRPMSGQSPFAVNANISYEIAEKQSAVSLAYNVQGEQLSIVASGRNPDVYTIPFHSIDFNAYYSFGENLNHRVTFGISNLADEDRTMVYRAIDADDTNFQTFKPGRVFKVRYAYTF